MRVAYGNAKPTAQDAKPMSVTYQTIPDEYTYEVAESAAALADEVRNARAAAMESSNGITRMPGQEAIQAAVAGYRANAAEDPLWVWSDNPEFAVLLGEYFHCPVGIPDDVEDVFHTYSGPPGVGPVNTDPDAEPVAPVLEGADAEKAQPPADAG